jgi:hypothetical protein
MDAAPAYNKAAHGLQSLKSDAPRGGGLAAPRQ